MKRAKKLMMLLLAVVLVSGCTMKEEVNMNIKDDKSVDLAVIVALDDELIDNMLSLDNQLGSSTDKEFTDEERWEFIEETFNSENSSIAKNLKGEKYEEGKFKGKKFTTTIDNIDEISSEKEDEVAKTSEMTGKEKLFLKKGNTYKADFKLDTSDSEEQAQEYEGADLSSIMDVSFVITLPQKPISHNASKVSDDGKTLTWDTADLTGKNIQFEFEFPKKAGITSDKNMFMYGIIAGVVVVLLIVIVLLVSKKGKKSNGQQPIVGAPMPPQPMPGTPVPGPQPMPVQPQPVPSEPVQPTPAPETVPNEPVQPEPTPEAAPSVPTPEKNTQEQAQTTDNTQNG